MKTKLLFTASALGLFTSFATRSIDKSAYEIKPDDKIERKNKTGPYTLTVVPIEGQEAIKFRFNATVEPVPGDYVCYASEEDVYHCPRDLFLERHFVDEPPESASANTEYMRLDLIRVAANMGHCTTASSIVSAAEEMLVFVEGKADTA